MSDESITVTEAAGLLGKSARSVRRMVERGYLQGGPLTPGGNIRVSRQSVVDLLEKWRARL